MKVHLMNFCGFGAVTLIIFLASMAIAHGEGGASNLPSALSHSPSSPSHSSRNWSRSSTSNHHANCEYKDLMTNLHDRVSILATLDEDLRDRLDKIDKKLSEMEVGNTNRLESLHVRQLDFLKRMDSMELIERMTKRDVEELKGEFDEMYKSANPKKVHVLSNELNRSTRQARVGVGSEPVDDSKKLDALASLLVSTSAAVKALQDQLSTNVTKLLQTTNQLQRRLNNLQRRQHGANANGHMATYLPPHPQQNYYAVSNQAQQLVTSCAQGAPHVNGILRLQLTANSIPFYVLCDDQSYGGGWTVILNRYTGDLNFQRNWQEYKNGFGNLAGEFFIGLEKLHALTSSAVHELIVGMEDFEGDQRYARYSLFAVGSEEESYVLKLLGSYDGTAGDALTYHAGSKFSTFDNDNDGCPDCNCAQAHTGAWWYNWCDMSNLNGQYFETEYNNTPTYHGMYWHTFHGPKYSLKAVRMMIRPVTPEDDSRR